jgi:hypothetical protein
VTPDIKLGFWSGSYFAGAVQYEDGWSGRYYGIKAEILTLGAGINGAYRINDWLSIGGGPFVLYGDLEQNVALNNLLEEQGGRLKFADDELGVGGMADLMLDARAAPGHPARRDLYLAGQARLQRYALDQEPGPGFSVPAEHAGSVHAPDRPRANRPAAGHAERLSRAQRPVGGHGQRGVAGLERVRQTGHLDTEHHRQQRDGQPRL